MLIDFRMSEAQALSALGDIDQSISSVKLRLGIARWLYVPALALGLMGIVVGFVLGMGSPGPLAVAVVVVAASVATFVYTSHRNEGDLADLLAEREALLHEFPALAEVEFRRRG